MVSYADHIYNVVRNESEFLDAIYEDFIIYLVGHIGLDELRKNQLVEACGVVNGKQLYTLIDKDKKRM